MAKSTKARVSKSGLSKKKGFQFKWWMGVVGIVVIVVVGIVIVRFSQASDVGNIVSSAASKTRLRVAFNDCDQAQRTAGNPNWGSNYNLGPDKPGFFQITQRAAHTACTKYLQTFFIEYAKASNVVVDGDYGLITKARTISLRNAINKFYEDRKFKAGWNKIFSDLSLGRADGSQSDVVTPGTWNWINRFTYLYIL